MINLELIKKGSVMFTMECKECGYVFDRCLGIVMKEEMEEYLNEHMSLHFK